MKKLKTVMLSATAVSLFTCSIVGASTADVIDEIYAIGSKYGATAAEKVKLERFVEDNDITKTQTEELLEKANEVDAIMEAAGVTDFSELSSSDIALVKSLANEAASAVGVTLSFQDGAIEIYKDGVLIEKIENNDGKLVYTGNTAFIALATSGVIIAAAAIILNTKKRA